MSKILKKLVIEIERETRRPVRVLNDFFQPLNQKYYSKCAGSCCCYECSYAGGYFRREVNQGPFMEPLTEEKYQKWFSFLKKEYSFVKRTKTSKHDGFFNPKLGCKLPRFLRSQTCLSHMCSRMKETDRIQVGSLTTRVEARDFARLMANEIVNTRNRLLNKML